jgi:nucleoside phosphorylase
VLVVAAWAPELVRLRTRLRGFSHRSQVFLEVIGVGLVEAGIGAALSIAKHRPSRLILVGTAGLLPDHKTALRINDVIDVSSASLASGSVLRGDAYVPAPLPLVVKPKNNRTKGGIGVICPLGITRKASLGRKLGHALNAHAENLEAFAVARAAERMHVQWEAFLGITNDVGPEANAQWRTNAKSAARAACDVIYDRITTLLIR